MKVKFTHIFAFLVAVISSDAFASSNGPLAGDSITCTNLKNKEQIEIKFQSPSNATVHLAGPLQAERWSKIYPGLQKSYQQFQVSITSSPGEGYVIKLLDLDEDVMESIEIGASINLAGSSDGIYWNKNGEEANLWCAYNK